MQDPHDWLAANRGRFRDQLASLVAIESISNDGRHAAELEASAERVRDLIQDAGLDARVIRGSSEYPYVWGEWSGAPGKPTVLLYSHHDVQPTAGFESDWRQESPWKLVEREGRLFGRGAVDDKGGFIAQLAAVSAHLKTRGKLPVNIKMIVEGEEEIGSPNLLSFFNEHKTTIQSDVIVVCDTENADTGIPGVTYSLRGNFSLLIEVESAMAPSHSGMVGGALADPAVALCVILSRLYWNRGPLPVPGFADAVRRLTPQERESLAKLPYDGEKTRRELGVLAGVELAHQPDKLFYEQVWREPAVTVIALEASSVANASNQVLPKARAIVSCRTVPDQDSADIARKLKAFLSADAPWGVKVKVTDRDKPAPWWMTDPRGPAFEAALAALREGYGAEPALLGAGGSIGFVGPLADLCGGAPALLLGINDGQSNAHAPNESVHIGDWHKLMGSLALLFDKIAELPGGKVK